MRIATGTQNFIELVKKSDKIVDKSLLIKEIIEDLSHAILFTAPRRWGKSVNLSMIKEFIERKVNENGDLIEREKTEAYSAFHRKIGFTSSASSTYEGLAIINSDARDHEGQYPVIYMDLKNCGGNTYISTKNKLKDKVIKEYERHSYLVHSSRKFSELGSIREKYNELVIKIKSIDESANNALDESLLNLSELLHKHHSKKVWILIDEYDAPINNMYFENDGVKNNNERERVVSLFKNVLSSALKNNEHLEKGILTGILRVAKGSTLSGLNNVEERSFADSKYAGLYGFTQKDVEDLFDDYNVRDGNLRKSFERHYNGYTTEIPNIKIYNPWSVLRALRQYSEFSGLSHDQILKPYWDESGSSNFIVNFLRHPIIAKDIARLTKGESIQFREIAPFEKTHLTTLEELVSDQESSLVIKTETRNLLLTYLKLTGYLDKNQKGSSVRIPNEEIRRNFNSKLESYYEEIFPRITSQQKNQVISALNELFVDSTQAAKNLQAHLSNMVQLIGEETKLNENFFHSLFNYIAYDNKQILYLGSEYRIEGSGKRADTVFLKEHQGVIVELKYGKSSQEALEQIERNQYYQVFHEYNEIQFNQINKVIHVGINFSYDKKVEVEIKVLML